MKRAIIITLLVSISSAAFAATMKNCDDRQHIIKNLDIDDVRATEVSEILSAFDGVKALAKNGNFSEIPVVLAKIEGELAAVLTEEEMARFKENIGNWSKSKDFSKFKGLSWHGE